MPPPAAPAPPPAQALSPPAAAGLDPAAYIGSGDAFNCGQFRSQADAQAVLRANPRDPNRLDGDRDGIACEGNPAPHDPVRVPR